MIRERKWAVPLLVLRVCVVTFLATIVSFAVALFFGIVTILLVAMIRGGAAINMSYAYRYVAFPVAVGVLVLAFISALIFEVREARRLRFQELRTEEEGTLPRAA
ncbi:MAG: hypothetical protein ACE14M_10690 [Terriglobales bacterium]